MGDGLARGVHPEDAARLLGAVVAGTGRRAPRRRHGTSVPGDGMSSAPRRRGQWAVPAPSASGSRPRHASVAWASGTSSRPRTIRRSPPARPRRVTGTPAAAAARRTSSACSLRHAGDHPAGRLGEQPRVVGPGSVDVEAGAAGHRHLGQRDAEAVGGVVDAGEDALRSPAPGRGRRAPGARRGRARARRRLDASLPRPARAGQRPGVGAEGDEACRRRRGARPAAAGRGGRPRRACRPPAWGRCRARGSRCRG